MAKELKPTRRAEEVPAPQSAEDVINQGLGGTPAPAAKKKPGPKPKPAAPAYPWQGVSEDATQPYKIELPAKLHTKLKWIGQMTWGSSMKQIVTAALEAEADKRLKAMGIDPE